MNAFNGAFTLDVIAGGVPNRFTGGEVPTAEQSGREIVTRQNGLAGLNVTRKLFVPLTGYFARALELFSNPTPDPITVDVQVDERRRRRTQRRCRRRAATAIVSVADAGDRGSLGDLRRRRRWRSRASAGGRPAVGFVFDGEGASTRAASASIRRRSPAQLQLGWSQITVPAGGTVAAARTSRRSRQRVRPWRRRPIACVRLAPEALEGLTPDEIAAVVNFAVPADGHSAVASLPPLTGTITGRVFEG